MTMQKRKVTRLFFGLLFLVSALGAPLLQPALASADVGNGQGDIFIKLSPNRTDVTVVAQRQKANGGPMSVSLKYNSGKQQWESGDIQGTQSGEDGCANTLDLQFKVVVSDKSGTLLATGGPYYAGCATQVNKTIKVPAKGSGTTNAATGGLQGTLSIYDPAINKKGLEYPIINDITLQSLSNGSPDGKVKKSYSNPSDSKGKYAISVASGVPGGVYAFSATGGYADSASPGNNRSVTFGGSSVVAVITAGKIGTLNLTEDFSDPNHPVIIATADAQKKIDAAIAAEKQAACTGLQGADLCKTDGNNHDSNATCDTGGAGLNWIICPVYNAVADFSDWVFRNLVEPLLRTTPVSTNSNDVGYKIWSSFRIYGNVFLVIALLVIVFGQSIGGGLIDAYTAKKVLPRILIAAILINLSIYIVAFLVDVTNILGGGLGSLITAPLGDQGAFNITPSGAQGGEVLGSATIVGALGVIAAGFGLIPPLGFILLMLVLPVALGLLAAFVTMIIRKAIILGLILVSPIAFALYCLPNTEQYFRKWWDLLVKTLLVYPLIIVIFAISDVLAVTVINGNNKANGLALVISFALQFIPLLLIPYAFKILGGAIGRLHEVFGNYNKRMAEGIKGNVNDQNSLRNRMKREYGEKMTRRSNAIQVAGQGDASWLKRRRGQMSRRLDRGANSRLSRYTAQAQEREEQESATGNDHYRYAANYQSYGAGEVAPTGLKAFDGTSIAAGTVFGSQRYFDSKGRELNQQDAETAYDQHASSEHSAGRNLEYALRKAQTDEDLANFRRGFVSTARRQGWDQNQMDDAWARSTFEHKDKFSSEWFSRPKLQSDGSVQFQDVADTPSSQNSQVSELHKARESFKLSSLRSQDLRSWDTRRNRIQDELDTTGTIADDGDAKFFAESDELLETMTQKGIVTREGDEGPYQASGVNAETKGVVEALMANRRWRTTQARSGTASAAGTPQYSVQARKIYNEKAAEAAVAASKPSTGAAPTISYRDAAHTVPGRVVDVTGDADRSTIPRKL